MTFKPPSHVHGGANAGLIDELMGILVWHHGFPSVTETLTCQYQKPVPLSATVFALTWMKTIDLDQIFISCQLSNDAGQAMITAQGTFHRLTQAQLDQLQN